MTLEEATLYVGHPICPHRGDRSTVQSIEPVGALVRFRLEDGRTVLEGLIDWLATDRLHARLYRAGEQKKTPA